MHLKSMTIHARLISIAVLVLLVGCSTTGKHAASGSAIIVTIPCNSHGERIAVVDSMSPDPFFVLLTNTGKKPVKLWEEWNSWGYYSLQLEVIGPDGQKHLLKKKPIPFYVNNPERLVLQPGQSAVWDVVLISNVWEDLSWIPEEREMKAQVKAIYSVKPDEESEINGVWTGRVTSQAYDFTTYRYAKHVNK